MTHPQKRLLAGFIEQVGKDQDTPSIIMLIAANVDYLWACRSIVDPDADPCPGSAADLDRICRERGWTVGELKAKLTPAARALGIMPVTPATDYYRVLGVGKEASLWEIKQAFRSRVIRFHPDTTSDPGGNGHRFKDLNDAYHTLRDPVRRLRYDAACQLTSRWREYPSRFLEREHRSALGLWYLVGLLVIFFGLFFVTIAITVD